MLEQLKVVPIHITVGLKSDAAPPQTAENTLGKLTTGPMGLLNAVETQLGIPSIDIPFTTRLIQYLACIDKVNHPSAFYHASYQADPFSVARTLLQWRDQWYMAGWVGTFEPDAPARLTDMAAIEALAQTEVEPGLGQRVQRVIALLADNPIAIASIHLQDKLTDFPALWRSLIFSIGVAITEKKESTPQGKLGTDLRKLQDRLLVNSKEKIHLSGDGSIQVLRGDSAQDSAILTALLTQQQLTEYPGRSLALLAEARGDLLDEALETIDAPRMGFSALSTWRPVFQVLPLACELLWEPLNPTALFRFLSHSMGPIPSRQRQELAKTAARVPGIGSDAWQLAIERCLEKEEEKDRKQFEDNLRYWLESPLHPPEVGVDSTTLSQRAQRVADWLMGARQANDNSALHSLYSIALNQALEFVKAIDRLKFHGRDTLTRDNVLRLIEDVKGSGAPVTDRQAQVCPEQTRALPATHAGAFHTPIDTVIWWDCQATDTVHRWPWSRSERAALTTNGVTLESEDAQLQWLGTAWLRPILSAAEQCILVLHDDVGRHHPVWDQIVSVTEDLTVLSTNNSATVETMGIRQKDLEPLRLPTKSRWWQLPEHIKLPKRDFESFSSLDAYVHSPYQWLLQYAARIRPGALATVNDGPLLKGNLAHRLYEEFFNNHSDIQNIELPLISAWVKSYVPRLLRQEGALLLEPGRQAECSRFVTVLQQSLKTLAEHLQQAAVVSVSMELWQEGLYAGGKLNGSIDLLATTGDGREAVVDIKWSGKNYRLKSLREGSYLQLATYGKLRRDAGAPSYPALGYFIVYDGQMLSMDHEFFPNAELIVPDPQENQAQYWARFEHTWRWRKEQFDKGLIEVTVANTETTEASLPGEAGLTLPTASDNFNDYAVLTGWEDNA